MHECALKSRRGKSNYAPLSMRCGRHSAMTPLSPHILGAIFSIAPVPSGEGTSSQKKTSTSIYDVSEHVRSVVRYVGGRGQIGSELVQIRWWTWSDRLRNGSDTLVDVVSGTLNRNKYVGGRGQRNREPAQIRLERSQRDVDLPALAKTRVFSV